MDSATQLIGLAYAVQIALLGMQLMIVAMLVVSGAANLLFAASAGTRPSRARLLRSLSPGKARIFGAGEISLGVLLLLPLVLGAPFWLTLLALAGTMGLFITYKHWLDASQSHPGLLVNGVLLLFPSILICVTLYERADMLEASRRVFGDAVKQRIEAVRWQVEHGSFSPAVGEMAVDFELSDPGGTRRVRLFDELGENPVALIFGSHT
jgi:hypothetical protein